MKKYLFLLFLYLFYLFIILNKKDTKMVSLSIDDDSCVKQVTLKYENGINSKNLLDVFSEYDNYLITNIQLDNNIYDVRCEKISDCIKDIYQEESNLFYLKYGASGFKVDSITYYKYE